MPCPKAIPCLPRQQLTAPKQCVAYTQEWKQPDVLVITDHSALGWEEREKGQQEIWHSFKSTASHLHTGKQKPHNALGLQLHFPEDRAEAAQL